jgi:hypothetical protein
MTEKSDVFTETGNNFKTQSGSVGFPKDAFFNTAGRMPSYYPQVSRVTGAQSTIENREHKNIFINSL